MFVACGIWCLADVSSVSPSSEQTVLAHAEKQFFSKVVFDYFQDITQKRSQLSCFVNLELVIPKLTKRTTDTAHVTYLKCKFALLSLICNSIYFMNTFRVRHQI